MERIGEGVRRELGRFGPAGAMAEVVTAWPLLAGAAIARNAWPARVARDGTLHVATSSSAWAYELAQLEPELAARLREALGEAAPARLRFAVGPLPEPEPERLEPGGPERRAPTDDEVGAARRLAAGIAAEELREAVARAAAEGLARAAADRSF